MYTYSTFTYVRSLGYVRILNLSVKEQKQRQADRTANLLSLRITHKHVCNVCMHVCIALLLVLIQRTSLSLHLRICVVVVALCALYACEMRIYWGNTSPKTATTTTSNNESRRIVLICHNLLFLLCLLCPRTRSAANCAARMRERRCWTQPNVRARSVCVVCWHCDADVATRRRESAAKSGKEREQTWEHRVVCFFAREYAYECVTMCVRVCVCLHCQRFVHSFFVISSY